jgi:predicted transcriptional regulator
MVSSYNPILLLRGELMLVRDIIKTLDAEILTGEENLDLDIKSGCGADLMSDVMAFVKDNVILLTGLINVQVVRTAEMMDIKVICFVRGKQPTEQIIELAKSKGITILCTKNPMFIACGLLYKAGLTGPGVWD